MATVVSYPLLGSIPFPLLPGAAVGPSGTRQVRVNAAIFDFGRAVRAEDPAYAHDATNPDNWQLQPYVPHDATERRVQRVEPIEDENAGAEGVAASVYVWFDGPLDASLDSEIVYLLGASGDIEDDTGAPLNAGNVIYAQLPTFGERHRAAEDGAGAQRRQDLANPQVDSDAAGGPVATLQLSDTGDYRLEAGPGYLRKRLLRRATTALGEFFHAPDYGFAEPLKGTYSLSDLMRMQARAQAQVLREPDVVDARVLVEQLQPGIVQISIRVVDREGRTEALTTRLPQEV